MFFPSQLLKKKNVQMPQAQQLYSTQEFAIKRKKKTEPKRRNPATQRFRFI